MTSVLVCSLARCPLRSNTLHVPVTFTAKRMQCRPSSKFVLPSCTTASHFRCERAAGDASSYTSRHFAGFQGDRFIQVRHGDIEPARGESHNLSQCSPKSLHRQLYIFVFSGFSARLLYLVDFVWMLIATRLRTYDEPEGFRSPGERMLKMNTLSSGVIFFYFASDAASSLSLKPSERKCMGVFMKAPNVKRIKSS